MPNTNSGSAGRTIAAALGLAAVLPLAAHAQTSPTVYTPFNIYQGTTTPQGVNEWLGIPYALPPVGALRWSPPHALPAGSATVAATQFSSSCPQASSQFGRPSVDEDCLYLNVYTPHTAKLQPTAAPLPTTTNLPVMVWIHGGAFITGEGADYDGSPLVQTGNVIVVTLNYRLGLLGFLANSLFAPNDPHGSTGDYGLQDQQAALNWVYHNIRAFGGNPNNITIFGESAGGASVEFQLTSPGLIKLHSAIIESGAYSQALPTLASAEAAGATTAATTLNCPAGATQLACLYALTPTQIVNAVSPLTLNVSPNVDGTLLTQQPIQAYAAGQFQHVPIINGSNHDEYRLFVGLDDFVGGGAVTPASYTSGINAAFGSFASQVLAEYPLSNYSGPAYPCAVAGNPSACVANYAYAALVTDYTFACGAHLLNSLLSQYTPVYSYELNDPNAPDEFLPYDPNLPNLGDSHAAEIPYFWPNITDPLLGLGPVPFSPHQLTLASTMRSFWTGLARYGRPLAPRAGVWQPYGAANTVLSLVPPAPVPETNFVTAHKCTFWKPFLLMEAGLPSTTPY